MANLQNLRSWQPGQSGNPNGKPKGTKHISNWILQMLEDESFYKKISGISIQEGAPVKVIVQSLILKAMDGDLKAIDLLAKYGYGTKHDVTLGYEPFTFNLQHDRFIKLKS